MLQVDASGMRIAYRRTGSGPPLVLLHGGFSDHRDWRPQIEDLSDAFEVVAWDAPGCGGSDDPPEDFSLDDYARCLAAFLEQIDVRRPHVMGISWGAGLALNLYQHRPVRSLTLVGAYAGWGGSLPPEEVKTRLERVMRDSELPPERLVERYLPTMFSSDPPQEVREEVAAIMAESRPFGLRVMVRGFAEADLDHVLPTIDVPTLLIWGEEDVRSPLTIAGHFHEQIEGSELVVIPNAGHMCNIEAPERFNAEARRFLTP